MKYKKFIFENYRGIKDKLELEIETSTKIPYCLIGNNESGKTTILQGIELIGNLCQGETIENGKRKAIKPKGDYFSGIVKLGALLSANKDEDANDEKYQVLSQYTENTINYDIEFSFLFHFERSSFVKYESNIVFNKSVINIEEHKKTIFSLIAEQAPEIIYYDDFKFTVPKYIRFIESGKTDNANFVGTANNLHWQRIFNDILKGTDNKAENFQQDVVEWHKNQNNDASIATSRLRNMGKYLDRILQEWIKNKNNINGFEIVRKQPENDNDKNCNDYQIKIISGDHSYDMDERSKGLQWSFCFHILTKIRQNRHDAGFIFLLDEPANNLHIRPQKQMLQHLNDLCNETSMVIYSTHSPELIITENYDYKNTFIVKNKAEELQANDIKLYKIDSKEIEIQDLEPILAKLAFEDTKSISNENNNDKKKWKEIRDKITNILPDIDKTVKLASIGNFLTNVVDKIF